MCWLTELFKSKEKSPSDWLPQEAITAKGGKVIVDLSKLIPGLSAPPKVWIPEVPGTGSMLPNFDHEHNNILIAGATEADHQLIIDHLQEGDIAVFRMMQDKNDSPADYTKVHVWYAIHRIIRMGMDEKGIYYKFKGDNNPVADNYKVREKNILYVSIGTIF